MDVDDQIVLRLPEDVNRICRTCMSVTENVLSHDIVLWECSGKTLAGQMLEFCASNSIEEQDGLPKSICDECANSLELFYNFKNQCKQTEINLRKILNISVKSKETKPNESQDILNLSENSSGIEIHPSSSAQNYIDIEVTNNQEEEITVENLLQKLRDSTTSADIKTQDLDLESDINSEIFSLIKERKEAPENEKIDQIFIKNEILSDEEINEIKCKVCETVFENKFEFNKHSQTCQNRTVVENILGLENDDIEKLYQDEDPEIYGHTCTKCGSKFKTKQGKNAHMAAHERVTLATEVPPTKEKIYPCDLCNKIFMTESKLASHFYKHAVHVRSEFEQNNKIIKNEKHLTCSYCYDSFPSKQNLIEHLKKHTKTGKTKCEICHLEFTGEVNLIRHLRVHDIHILLCKICLKRFDNLVTLKEHMKLHLIETIKTAFKCPICKSEFTEIESLKIHTLEHLEDVYECKKCRKTFHNKVAFDNHEKQHNEPRFLCSLCGKQYFSSVTLACHIRSHNNEKPFICVHCKKGFSSRATLSVHKRIHSSFKPYVCSYCGYSCRQSGDLAMHIRTHTGDKPYKCTFPNCDRKFTTSSQRKEHYRRHTNERNHKCKICSKAFLESKTLKVHMLVHTGEKPHPCGICGKRFRRSHHLSNHMKGHREQILGI